MEQTWKDVFRITEEDEANSENAHSEHINSYVNIFHERLKAHNSSNLSRLNNDNFYTKKIELQEIMTYLKRTKKKTPGESKINKIIFEKCTENPMKQLVNIFNACFSAGYFPTCYKKGMIKFIPKEGKSSLNPLNYRPISMLEVPGKMYERIIQGRLYAFLIDNNTIHDRQHGFRPQKGNTTALTVTHETIANALANKHQVYVVLTHVAKAFDKVWINGLKYKLLNLGLPAILQKTLCNFLDNRTATIKIGEEFSSDIELLSGVPQGSVLSPTLYTLFTTDLPPAGPGSLDILYAGDITQVITSLSKSKSMMKLKS